MHVDVRNGSRRAVAASPRRWWARWQVQVGLLVLVVVALVAWLGYRAFQVRRELDAAKRALVTARHQILEGGGDARASLAVAAEHARNARGAVRDPVWVAAAHLPFVGGAFRTAAGIAEISDQLTHTDLAVLADAAHQLDTVRASGASQLPLATLAALAGPLQAVDNHLAADIYAIQHLPSAGILPPVADARDTLIAQLRQLRGPVHTAAAAARIGPAMLGADGPRRYFVAFENPAESRPDGGLLGGYAEVVADRGKLTVVRFGPNSDLPPLSTFATGVPGSFLASYGRFGGGQDWVSTNLSPDFGEDAGAWAAMYAEARSVKVDGVIGLDPVALSTLAGLTGGDLPIAGYGTIRTAALPQFLESGEYALGLGHDARKDFVAAAGKATLDRLVKTRVPARNLLTALGKLAGEGHLHLASARGAEQAELRTFPLGGTVPRTTRPYVGAFVANAAGSKLDYYLDTSLGYRVDGSHGKGRRVTVTVRLHNGVPATPLPAYVTIRSDHPDPPVPVGQNRVRLTIVGTAGGSFVAGAVGGTAAAETVFGTTTPPANTPTMERSAIQGHPAWTTYVELPPRTDVVVTLTLDEPAGSTGAPIVGRQAMARPVTVTIGH